MHALVVHGGAGAAASPERADRQREACERALALGWEILAGGGRAVDAVVRAVVHLEDDPALNAGYGACLTTAGTIELDASVMEGSERRAGAVALIHRLRNPVLLARSLMENGPHLFMAGEEAERLAAARGFSLVEPNTLVTEERRRAWEERRRQGADAPNATDDSSGHGTGYGTGRRPDPGLPGTVGAVALDTRGHVAAATSTGGVAMKRPGRIGDSPIIGAGTLADDRAGAASATGDGEAIIRATLASTALEHLRRGLAPDRAAVLSLAAVTAVGGSAGIVLIDRSGRVAGVHTTPHMTWCSRQS